MTSLIPQDEIVEQLIIFDMDAKGDAPIGRTDCARQERLEAAADRLRQKHGKGGISLGFGNDESVGLVIDALNPTLPAQEFPLILNIIQVVSVDKHTLERLIYMVK